MIMLSQAQADDLQETGNKGFCAKAETTVDLLECIDTRYQKERDYLNDVYESLMSEKDLTPEFLASLENNQTLWQSYKDDLCMLEASVYKGGSLERVQQIDCLARITSERSDTLIALTDITDISNIPVFAAPPRWANTLITDYPEIYWSFAKAQDFDINCDETNEKIVSGVRFNDDNQTIPVIAIVNNTLTGRPSSRLVTLPKQSCALKSPLSLTSLEGETNENKACRFSVSMADETCSPMMLMYDNAQHTYEILTKEEYIVNE